MIVQVIDLHSASKISSPNDNGRSLCSIDSTSEVILDNQNLASSLHSDANNMN